MPDNVALCLLQKLNNNSDILHPHPHKPKVVMRQTGALCDD